MGRATMLPSGASIHTTSEISDMVNTAISTATADVTSIIQMESYLNFPTIGKANNLYIDSSQNVSYRWDNTSLKYYAVGNDYKDIAVIQGTITL